MKRDQCAVRCSVLDCFWEGRRDEACNSNVAHHLCDQGGSWYALSGRLVGIQEGPMRVGSTGRCQQLGDSRIEKSLTLHEGWTPFWQSEECRDRGETRTRHLQR